METIFVRHACLYIAIVRLEPTLRLESNDCLNILSNQNPANGAIVIFKDDNTPVMVEATVVKSWFGEFKNEVKHLLTLFSKYINI